MYWSPLFGAIGIAWALLGGIDLFSDEFGSPKLQKKLRAGDHIPHLSPAAWLAIGLGIVTAAGIRGAWKELKSADEKHLAELESERAVIAAERAAHQETQAELDRQLALPVMPQHRDRLKMTARSIFLPRVATLLANTLTAKSMVTTGR